MKKLIGWIGILMVTAVLGSGCKTTGSSFGLTVSNNSDAKVVDVDVLLDGVVAYHVAQLKPREIMEIPVKVQAVGPRQSTVRWKTESGDTVEKTFTPETPLPTRFGGQLDMEFKSDRDVVMFSDLKQSREGSKIPWARPEAWEGAPTIPGLSGQE